MQSPILIDGLNHFDTPVDAICQNQPTQFLEEAHELLDWQITNALMTKRDEAVLRVDQRLCANRGAMHIDELFNLVKNSPIMALWIAAAYQHLAAWRG